MAELQSDKALVCHQQHRADCGVGTVWFVLLADGYLIDCGATGLSQARAETLARLINEAGAHYLTRETLANVQVQP